MQSLVGTTAPDFSAITSEGDEFNLSDLDGRWKVLFFYAEDGSPTCKRGCLSFKEQYNIFKSLEPPAEKSGAVVPTSDCMASRVLCFDLI